MDNRAPKFVKSSFSDDSAYCVEVALSETEILVRDSKQPDAACLRFTPREWRAFVLGVKAGEFDR